MDYMRREVIIRMMTIDFTQIQNNTSLISHNTKTDEKQTYYLNILI
jgi:hypothetical protein